MASTAPEPSSTDLKRARRARLARIERDDAVLLKPVTTLAMVTKEKKITVLARRVWNVLLYQAQRQGLEREVFHLPLAEVVRNLDYDSKDLDHIKKHLRAMLSTVVEWQSATTGEGVVWSACSLLAHTKLTKARGELLLEWSYAVNMRQELIEPRVFALLDLSILSQFRSHQGMALWEICERYKAVGRTSRQPWKFWRPVLSGRPDNEQLGKMEYRIFKRDFLRGAIAEVNALTGLEIELVEFKSGRFISDLQFLINVKRQADLPLKDATQPLDMTLITEAKHAGIALEQAEALVEEFGEAALKSGLEALKKRIETSFPEPLRDNYRYLRSLMPGEARLATKRKFEAAALAEPTSAPSRLVQAQRQAGWIEQWQRDRRQVIVAEIEALSAAAQIELADELLRDMTRRDMHPSIRNRLATEGWRHRLVVAEMVRFYAAATHGDDWDKPSAQDILEVAARLN